MAVVGKMVSGGEGDGGDLIGMNEKVLLQNAWLGLRC